MFRAVRKDFRAVLNLPILSRAGVLKTTRVTLNPGDRYEDSALHDEPHTLYLFLGDTKLEYHFNPDKMVSGGANTPGGSEVNQESSLGEPTSAGTKL